MIPFNRPYFPGEEIDYLNQSISSGHVSGNGIFTKRCQEYFREKWGFRKCLLTTSCTDALEMCALLLNIKPGDEVIVPSYTFVSSALAFVREGAKIVFADSRADHPGVNEDALESLITQRTKAIVVVHYAGVACDMDKIMTIAERHGLAVVEDAAQAVDGYYKGRPLGGIGHLGCFSFHETKNIHCGEGGMLAINDEKYQERAEILWEKGTNRAQFFRGEINKYGWVDVGSSFLASDLNAAVLFAQLKNLEEIQNKRKSIWTAYQRNLPVLEKCGVGLPEIPAYATNNGHMFYLICDSLDQRSRLIQHLRERNIHSVFHYQALHRSPFYAPRHDERLLPEADRYTACLVRLPFYVDLEVEDVEKVSAEILRFFEV